MPPDIKTAIVNAFLTGLNHAIRQGRFTFWADRPDMKNQKTLDLLQYTIKDVTAQFAALKRENYRKGPVEDKRFPNDQELWHFRKMIDAYDIYMKVKWIKSQDWFIGISFHENEE